MSDEKKITRERINHILGDQDRIAANLKEVDTNKEEGRMYTMMGNIQSTKDELEDINQILTSSAYDVHLKEKNDLKKGGKVLVDDGVGQVYSETKKLQLTDEEIAILHQKKSMDLAHLILNENSKKDSSEMKEVKFHVEALVNTLEASRELPANLEAFNTLEESYRLAIDACETYVYSDKKKSEHRRKLVREVWLDLMYAADVLYFMREDLAKGEYEGKTMGQVLHMSSAEKNHVKRPPKKAKKNAKAPVKKANPTLDQVKNLFSEAFSPSKSITDKGTSAKARRKQANGLKSIRDALRSFDPGRITVRDIDFFGQKIKIMQDADNKLFVMDGHDKVALNVTANVISLKIENDIMDNGHLYGAALTAEIVDDIKIDLNSKKEKRKMGSKAQIRQNLINYLCRKLNLIPNDFTGISRNKIMEFTERLAKGEITKNTDVNALKAQLIEEIKATAKEQSKRFVNGVELTELMEQDAERDEAEIESKFSYLIENQNVMPEEDWSKEEIAVKNLLADLIFAQDTLVMDKNAENPAGFMLETLKNHQEALTFLLKDKQAAAGKEAGPDMLDTMMEKLSLNLVKEGGNDLPKVICEQLKTLRDMLHSKLTKPEDAMDEKKAAKQVESLLIKPDEEMTAALTDAKTKMDSSVAKACEILQSNVSFLTGIVFPETSVEEQQKNEEKASLKQIIKDSTKSSKGQGQFIRQALNQYFGKVSAMDQRAMLSAMIRYGKKIKEVDEVKIKVSDKWLVKMFHTKEEKTFLAHHFEDVETYGKKITPEQQKVLDDFRVRQENKAWAEEIMEKGDVKYKEAFEADSSWKQRGELTPKLKEVMEAYKTEKKQIKVCANHLGGLIKGAGPLMQKLLQGLPKEGLPEGLVEALEDVKSNLVPIPERVVKSQMLALVDRSGGAITKMEVTKSLGAASVGQAFLCRIYGPNIPEEGKEVVVKLLRSDAKNRMDREAEIMKECASQVDPGILATYEGQLKIYQQELDLKVESVNIQTGVEKYKGQFEDVKTVELNDNIPASSTSMVMEKAPGTTLDSYIDELHELTHESREKFLIRDEEGIIIEDKFTNFKNSDIELMTQERNRLTEKIEEAIKRRDHLANLCNAWLKQGIFKSGYYHGDLHSGNIMVSDEQATMIDFGNAVTLTETQQQSIVKMSVSVGTGNEDLFFEAFENILKENADEAFNQFYTKEMSDKVRALVTKIMNMGEDGEEDLRFQVFLIKVQEMGIKIPPEVNNFCQGQVRLQNSVSELNDAIKEMKDLIFQIETKHDTGNTGIDPVSILQKKTSGAIDDGRISKDDAMANAYRSNMNDLSEEIDEEAFKREFLEKKEIAEDKEKGIKGSSARDDFMNKYFGDLRDLKEKLSEEETQDEFPYKDEEAEYKDERGYATDENGKLLTKTMSVLESLGTFQDTLDRFFEKNKDLELGSEELKTAARKTNSLLCLPLELGEEVLQGFGGITYIMAELEEALINKNRARAQELVNIYTVVLKKVMDLQEKKEALNEGQDAFFFGMSKADQQELAEESCALYKEIHKFQSKNHSFVMNFQERLRLLTVAANNLTEKELEGMFGVQTQGHGQKLKEAWEKYKKILSEVYNEREEGNSINLVPKEDTTEEKLNELSMIKSDLLEQYRVTAYFRLKEYHDKMFAKEVSVKEFGYEKVLKDVIKQNFGDFSSKLGKIETGKLIAQAGKEMMKELFS